MRESLIVIYGRSSVCVSGGGVSMIKIDKNREHKCIKGRRDEAARKKKKKD